MLASIGGTQGSGKSTTISDFVNTFNTKEITRKTSRSILSDWGVTLQEVNNNADLTMRFQDEILTRKLADDSIGKDTDELFITERTFTDLFVYALIALGKDNVHSAWIDEYYERCVEANKIYDYVFVLPGGVFPVENDGVRGVNQHYNKLVEQAMSHFNQTMNTGIIHNVESMGRVDRAYEIYDAINQ